MRAAPTPGGLRHFELRPFLCPGPCRAKSPKKVTSEGAGGPGFGEVAKIVGPDDACTQDQGEDQTLADGSQALATEDQKSVATKKSKKEVETEEDAKKQLRRLLESNMKTTGEAELLQMNVPEGLGLAVSEVLRQNLIVGQGSRGGASARVGQHEPRRPPAPLSGIPPVCAPTVPTLPQTRTEVNGSGRGDTAAHVAIHAHLCGRTHARTLRFFFVACFGDIRRYLDVGPNEGRPVPKADRGRRRRPTGKEGCHRFFRGHPAE